VKQASLLLIAALVLLAAGSLVSAQTGEWNLSWYTIDGGGATSTGGDLYALSGTIGQPDAGEMAGGLYRLNGGFWTPTRPGGYAVYLPLIMR
jgi:hypothetical protein